MVIKSKAFDSFMADIPANLNTSHEIVKYWSEYNKPELVDVSDCPQIV